MRADGNEHAKIRSEWTFDIVKQKEEIFLRDE